MKKAADILVGTHDFKSFCSVNTPVEDTVRTIFDCTVAQDGDSITIRVTGSGFLYNMVRIIAGTLIQVGLGRMEAQHIEEILKAKDRRAAGPTAPAHGLTMLGIVYE
jgi:tRNA pseudouridine38-40 synthase